MENLESILLAIGLLIACIICSVSIAKMKKQINTLKDDVLLNNKILSKRIDSIKNDIDTKSESLLVESKSHLDAALIAMSKRIGKSKQPTKGKDKLPFLR